MTAWINVDGRTRRVEVPEEALHGIAASYVVDGAVVAVDGCVVQPGVVSLIVAGRQFRCVLDGDAVIIVGQRIEFNATDPRSLASQKGGNAAGGGARAVKAPMPGRVVRVMVEAGDAVEEQQGLVVIEAMKMQNELKSPKAGTVVKLAVEAGATVAAGDVLVVVE